MLVLILVLKMYEPLDTGFNLINKFGLQKYNQNHNYMK